MGLLEERESRPVPLVIRIRAVPAGVAMDGSMVLKNVILLHVLLESLAPLELVPAI